MEGLIPLACKCNRTTPINTITPTLLVSVDTGLGVDAVKNIRAGLDPDGVGADPRVHVVGLDLLAEVESRAADHLLDLVHVDDLRVAFFGLVAY